jgi:hypothetical protein
VYYSVDHVSIESFPGDYRDPRSITIKGLRTMASYSISGSGDAFCTFFQRNRFMESNSEGTLIFDGILSAGCRIDCKLSVPSEESSSLSSIQIFGFMLGTAVGITFLSVSVCQIYKHRDDLEQV